MKESITYNDRKIEIRAYSGSIERDLILYGYSRTPENPAKLEDLTFILKDHIKSNIPLNKLEPEELVYIFYCLRGISVSDSIPLSLDCPVCSSKFNLSIDINKILKEKNYNCSLLKNTYSKNAEDYLTPGTLFRLEENILLYDRIINYIEKTKTKFTYFREIKCPNCNTPHSLDLMDLKILCSVFSSFDIQGFYNSINSLVYYGKCSMYDLMEVMLPFERELLTSYIQNEIERAEKQNSGSKPQF